MSSPLLSTAYIILCILLGPPVLLGGFAVAFAAACGLCFLWLSSLSLGVVVLCIKVRGMPYLDLRLGGKQERGGLFRRTCSWRAPRVNSPWPQRAAVFAYNC